MPLFTRVEKDEALDHFNRGQIYGYIKTSPGVHYNKIRKELEIKNGVLSYHLNLLEKIGLIKSRREGMRYRAFYPTGMKFPEEERYRLTDLQIAILEKIKENEGITQKEIAAMLGEKQQKISYNIKALERAGKIRMIKKGRKKKCYLTEEVKEISE